MTPILLKAKLHIPPARSEQVRRASLFARLDAGFQHKLTLVSAPAGFGKTSLVSAWLRDRQFPAAWFSVDGEDNREERFWSYFVAALQTLEGIREKTRSGLEALPDAAHQPLSHTILPELLNLAWEIQPRFMLVLDDFQFIENAQILDGIWFLLEHIPPAMHLLISTRADPPWPLARLRGQGEITELRIDNLRFSLEETAGFLNSVMGLALAPQDVQALDERTEGWVVGLQMAALSLQGRDDKAEFIRAFTGSHRFVIDYLSEEVLDRQPAELREFLLKTSLLERMTGTLCDAVLNRQDSHRILDYFEKANYFLFPLDDERRWFRYHHLFADILHSNLLHQFPDQVKELHQRASQWYAKHGLLPEAARHAFISGDIDTVTQLVEENALAVITVFSLHLPDLVGWLNALPEALLRSRPSLAVARAWVLAYSGELQAARMVIAALPPETAPGSISLSQLAGYMEAIRGYCAFMAGEIPEAVACMEIAIQQLPPHDAPTHAFARTVYAAAIGMQGDLAGSVQILTQAVNPWLDEKDPLRSIMVLSELAGLQLLKGSLDQVIAACEEALRLSQDYYLLTGIYPPNLCFAFARLGFALRERNELPAAIRYGEEAVKIAQLWGQKDSLSISCLYLALSLQAAGRAGEANEQMQKARQVSQELHGGIDTHLAAYEARFHGGNFLLRWAEECGLSSTDDLVFNRAREYIVYARALLFQGRTQESLALIARLLPVVETAGAGLYRIELLLLQAMALHAQGESLAALRPLKRALGLAEPEGYLRIFISEKERLEELLRQVTRDRLCGDYACRLLAVLPAESQPGQGAARLAAGVVDKLTAREVEIMTLLMTPRSVSQIAVELCIATSTLRTHLRNIYDKLGVHSRIEAVALASQG